MASRFRTVVLSIGLLGPAAVNAKPPELPTGPATEFKVLPSYAQEHYQPEPALQRELFLPVPLTGPFPAAGCGSLTSRWPAQGLEVLKSSHRWKNDLAGTAYEMAETHRQAGDWEEASRWYAGIKHLWPESPYAKLAGERLDRYALLRIAAEAGEEQSEEPPLASGIERLNIPPRQAKP